MEYKQVQGNANTRQESRAGAEGISSRLERIEELKESLRYVSDLSEEASLLNDLTKEISALRQLRGLSR